MRISPISPLARGLALPACSLYFEQNADDGAGDADPCPLAGPADPPGYPFEVAYYQQVMWTLTQRSCGSGGCHAPGSSGFSDFRVWAGPGTAEYDVLGHVVPAWSRFQPGTPAAY